MVLGHSHRRSSAASPQKGKSTSISGDEHDNLTEDETVVDAEQGNILMHIISQLRPGADLSRVTLPTFFLEPRSMLERITNFMAHPEILLPIPKIDDPVERFVAVVKFYLSGWHIKPPGVKKPLNPILGELFTGYWDYSDGTKGYYIAEQTSHHPPKSSYFFMAPEHHIRVDGALKPRSKFLGNSAASMMEGVAVLRFANRGERYFVTQPNMYARGILFGKMKYELGDHSFVRCPESGLMADLEFKTKGYFSGVYNAIGGFIKDTKTDKNLYELSGLWNGEMFIKNLATGKKELLFDATHAKETPPVTRPIEEHEDIESQRLWQKVNIAIKNRDQDAATDEKSLIENAQREKAARRLEEGTEWKPRLFRAVHGGPGGTEEGEEDLDWIISAKVDGATPEEQVKQILAIHPILPGQQSSRKDSIPAQKSTAPHSPSEQAAEPSQEIPSPHEAARTAAALAAASVAAATTATSAAAPSPAPSPLRNVYSPPTANSGSTMTSPDTLAAAPALQQAEAILQQPEPTQQSSSLSTEMKPLTNGSLIDPGTGNNSRETSTTHLQSISELDLPSSDQTPQFNPPEEAKLVDSMNKLKVGDYKEQAAEITHSSQTTPKVLVPRKEVEVNKEARGPVIHRMDSRTHEIDEFMDAEP